MTPNKLEHLLGRRFEFAAQAAPDVTLVAYDMKAGTVRLHVLGGARQSIPLAKFIKAVNAGALAETPKRPFVHDREDKFDIRKAIRTAGKNVGSIGVMGKNKTIIPHMQLLKGRTR